MATFKIATAGGPVEVEGRRFSHYISNIRFWFIVHSAHDRTNQLVVSHQASGHRVCLIPVLRLSAHRMDQVSAARATLDELCASKGAERVYSVLSAAEAQPTNPTARSAP